MEMRERKSRNDLKMHSYCKDNNGVAHERDEGIHSTLR